MRWLNQTRRETKEHVAAVAVIVAITLIFFSPVLRGRSFSTVGAHHVCSISTGRRHSGRSARGEWSWVCANRPCGWTVSRFSFATNALRSGQLPMWLPYSFNGSPIMEADGCGIDLSPANAGATVLSPIRQHDLLLFTHLLFAGLGMYALLRCWGTNVLGALFGAVVWQFNGHSAFFLVFEFSLWLPRGFR